MLCAGLLAMTVLASPPPPAAAPQPSAAPPHLKYMSDFDTRTSDMQQRQHGWLNLLIPEVLDACTEANGPVCPDTLQQIAEGYDKYKIPSLYGNLPDLHGNGQGVFDIAHKGLDPKWQENLVAITAALKPFLANGSCVGIFVGDEIVASHGVPFANYTTVVSRLRELVGPKAILMANEGSDLWDWGQTAHDGEARFQVAKDLDYFSIDLYDGWNENGTWEVDMVRAIYEAQIFPAMSPTQRAFVVPGTFGCPGDLGLQAPQIVKKLEAYYAWAKVEPRIAGISSWHFANRTGAAHRTAAAQRRARRQTQRATAPDSAGEDCPVGSMLCANTNICVPSSCGPCTALCQNKKIKAAHCSAASQSAIGAEAMPEVVAALSSIGKQIVKGQQQGGTTATAGDALGTQDGNDAKDTDAAAQHVSSDTACSLNGQLNAAGTCICRQAWEGTKCSVLVLQPATVAFQMPGQVAWGMAMQQDLAGDWHAFVCVYPGGLGNWDPSSHIVHATAKNPSGPYELTGPIAALGHYHASPAILAVEEGGLPIYYLYPTGSQWNGTNRDSTPYNLVVSVSRSLHGPWNTSDITSAFGGLGTVLNVGVIHLSNKQFALSGDTHSSNGGVFTSPTPTGPFVPASSSCRGLPKTCGSCNTSGGWVFDQNPRPQTHYREGHRIYQDRDGYFHVLCHAMSLHGDTVACGKGACDSSPDCSETISGESRDDDTAVPANSDPPTTNFPPHCGGHKFAQSLEGPWHDSPVGPYTTTVEWANGETTVGYRRERPFALLDPSTGDPTYLFNGMVRLLVLSPARIPWATCTSSSSLS